MFGEKKLIESEARLAATRMILWIVAQRNGGSFSVTDEEIDTVPDGAQLKQHPVAGGIEFISKVKTLTAVEPEMTS